ncbi:MULTISPECIES: pilus assembly protein [unclassified Caballeronia]|uniref:TadE/TadG family type IV pilus assembly protein n=1 Tax=unclassified Caballeronia TaxID=2646786 RepID=UPI002862AF53|nr:MULTISPECIES: pilus assembly protein [unclassified Caballeronia]MDR5773646.1 pilus assembly protein [Caballeronia sp. LZ002]MDR5805627.1 pilus assembly protein [Caballeronia sp. LZ001]MDR5849080.1 pilus assembly protein [Caballeronia sp. LZ003]
MNDTTIRNTHDESTASRFVPRFARDEEGATALEFAIVFPLFFLIFYAIVTYSLIFVAQQSLTLSAEEGARAALRYQRGATNAAQALDLRTAATCTTANGLKNWLGSASTCTASRAPCTYDTTMQCVAVALSYDYASNPLVPTLPLLSLALPAKLTANASVQLNPDSVL